MAAALATMVAVMKFFGATPAAFRLEWNQLAEDDKTALKRGIGDGSLTY